MSQPPRSLVVFCAGQVLRGQHREPEKRQSERLVDEHRVERLEKRVAGIEEDGDARDPMRAADPVEEQVQQQDKQQVGESHDDQPGSEDREPADRDKGRCDLFQPGVERADRQQVVGLEELACLQDIHRAAPVHELIAEGEAGRAVADLDQVFRNGQNHHESHGLAHTQVAPAEQPGCHGSDNKHLAEPVGTVRPW